MTTRRVLSALDLYVVFGAHDREAAMRSARPQGRAEDHVGVSPGVSIAWWCCRTSSAVGLPDLFNGSNA